MEPWKLGVIALMGALAIGYGVVANQKPSATTAITNNGTGSISSTPLPIPTPSKYVGKTLYSWPNITQWANASGPISLDEYKGKPVLLEVFRIECSHCQEAAPYIVKLYERYGSRGVQFIGIQSPGAFSDPENPENNWTTVQSWLKDKGYTWPVGFDGKSAWFQGKFGKNVFYPSLFLIDSNGKVVFFQSGHDLRKAMELAIQLEKIAPGQGDAKKRADELAKFLGAQLGLSDATMEKSLTADLAPRLEKQDPYS